MAQSRQAHKENKGIGKLCDLAPLREIVYFLTHHPACVDFPAQPRVAASLEDGAFTRSVEYELWVG
jgi:hypothetical protein